MWSIAVEEKRLSTFTPVLYLSTILRYFSSVPFMALCLILYILDRNIIFFTALHLFNSFSY